MIGAFVALSEDVGSCPVPIPPSGYDHTFPGTNIYIMPVVQTLEALSILAFLSGAVIFVISRYRRRGASASGLPPE